MRSAFILLVALQLLFSRFISFRVIAYFFFAYPPASCIYIDSYIPLQVISYGYRSFLSAKEACIYLQATVRPPLVVG